MHFLSVIAVILAMLESCISDPAVAPRVAVTSPIITPIEQISPKPCAFGYEFSDGFGMTQHRQEEADVTGIVKGSYGYVDPFGVNRIVEYTADNNGYKAVVRSNESGLTSKNSANVLYFVQPAPAAALTQGLKPSLPKLAF